MKSLLPALFIAILFLITLDSCINKDIRPWYLFETNEGSFGYIDEEGDTMIAAGKYLMCFSDTLLTLGIVMDKEYGIIGIDQAENILFNVFPYDNGPDYVSDGLFRIIIEGKIGYASKNGKILIEPHYSCAYPFQNGKAKVSLDCQTEVTLEHSKWESDNWFYIDKEGNIISQ